MPHATTPIEDGSKQRIKDLEDAVTWHIFYFVSRGLAEEHKLALAVELSFQLLVQQGLLTLAQKDFFMRGHEMLPGDDAGAENPFVWLPARNWLSVVCLSQVEGFGKLIADIEGIILTLHLLYANTM